MCPPITYVAVSHRFGVFQKLYVLKWRKYGGGSERKIWK
jgi:hypothetical protein